MSEEETPQPILVPFSKLTTEVLEQIVQSYILREGTDYGDVEYSLDQKVKQVLHQIHKEELLISFDPATESINIINPRDWQKYQASQRS